MYSSVEPVGGTGRALGMLSTMKMKYPQQKESCDSTRDTSTMSSPHLPNATCPSWHEMTEGRDEMKDHRGEGNIDESPPPSRAEQDIEQNIRWAEQYEGTGSVTQEEKTNVTRRDTAGR